MGRDIRFSRRWFYKKFLFFILLLISFGLLFKVHIVHADPYKGFSAPNEDDNFITFLENDNFFSSVFQLEASGLAKGMAKTPPWSGSYWPIHKGILAIRYADSTFPDTKSFPENYSHYVSKSSDSYVYSGNINEMSPAEKYDLLVGNHDWTLTKGMWAKGLEDYQKDGIVATWTGICHGWAAATHMETPMPMRPVTVRDVTGVHSITFSSSDIKGLASYLWAESSPQSVRAGNRCRQGVIDKDPYLRPIDPSCLDSNPMTWHLTVTNRLGLYGKSFVMDASYGTEVWNYPVSGYDYNYFNPRTMETTHSLKAAIMPISEVTNDRYVSHRNPAAKYLVGIIMDTYHPALTEPRSGGSSGITMQAHQFYYDLELDQNYLIVGGEWYSKERPDFLWSFPRDSSAMTREDVVLGSEVWDTNSPLPASIAAKAVEASQRHKVLGKIVTALVQQSSATVAP